MAQKPPPERSASEGDKKEIGKTPENRFKTLARRIVLVPTEDLKEQERRYEEQKAQSR
jgi:ribosomal protein S3AE